MRASGDERSTPLPRRVQVVFVLIAVGLVLLAVFGCGGDAPRSADTPAPPPTEGAASPFTSATVVEFRALQPRTTLIAWRSAHGGDSIAPFGVDGPVGTGPWCARAAAPVRAADGRAGTRYAFFYQPFPPTNLRPPAADSTPVIERDCRLGMVVVAWPTGEPSTVDAHLTALREGLEAQLGTGPAPLGGADSQPIGNQWVVAGVRYGADLGELDPDAEGDDDEPAVNDTIFVTASLPRADSAIAFGESVEYREAQRRWLRSLLGSLASRVDPRGAREILGIVDRSLAYQANPATPATTRDLAAFPDAWIRWLGSTSSRDSSKRPAALLFADVSLNEVIPLLYSVTDSGALARSEYLRSYGATIDTSNHRVSHYGRDWLDSAAAWPADPWMRAALFMARTILDDDVCALDLDSAAAAGERVLPALRDNAMAGAVRLMLARIYADKALAIPMDPSRPRAWARHATVESLSKRAVTHLHAAYRMSRLVGYGSARQAWWVWWRLEAGVQPSLQHFGSTCGD